AARERGVPCDPAARRGDRQRSIAEVRLRGGRRGKGRVPPGEDRAAGRWAAGRPRGPDAGGVGRGGRAAAGPARDHGRRAAGDGPSAGDGRGCRPHPLHHRARSRPAAMNISRFFIDRPIFAAVLSIVTLILGSIAYETLSVAQYPDVVPPTIVV